MTSRPNAKRMFSRLMMSLMSVDDAVLLGYSKLVGRHPKRAAGAGRVAAMIGDLAGRCQSDRLLQPHQLSVVPVALIGPAHFATSLATNLPRYSGVRRSGATT